MMTNTMNNNTATVTKKANPWAACKKRMKRTEAIVILNDLTIAIMDDIDAVETAKKGADFADIFDLQQLQEKLFQLSFDKTSLLSDLNKCWVDSSKIEDLTNAIVKRSDDLHTELKKLCATA